MFLTSLVVRASNLCEEEDTLFLKPCSFGPSIYYLLINLSKNYNYLKLLWIKIRTNHHLCTVFLKVCKEYLRHHLIFSLLKFYFSVSFKKKSLGWVLTFTTNILWKHYFYILQVRKLILKDIGVVKDNTLLFNLLMTFYIIMQWTST